MSQSELARAETLAVFLDKMAGNLANDLEWALDLFEILKEQMPERMPKDQNLAARYVQARNNLKTRRLYELACRQAA